MKRGGAYYSTLATQLIDSHYNDLGQVHVVKPAARGAVKAGLRTGCWSSRRVWIERCASAPRKASAVGLLWACGSGQDVSNFRPSRQPFTEQECRLPGPADAPARSKADKVQQVLDDMLQTNRTWLPQFTRRSPMRYFLGV